ncbi:hypothetical protein HPB47_001404, partial [Ixodes persulcatus]
LSTNEDHRLLFRRIKADSIIPYDRLWSKAVIGQVASGRAVIMGDLTTVQYQAAKHCWQFPDSELYFVREKLFSFSMVVYLNKNLPRSFVDCWNKRLSTLVESGLMSKWYEETIALAGHFSRCPKLGTKELDTVAFNHLRPVFLCYVFGLALAAATFVAEWPGNCVWSAAKKPRGIQQQDDSESIRRERRRREGGTSKLATKEAKMNWRAEDRASISGAVGTLMEKGSAIYPEAVNSSLINPEAPSYVAVEGDLEAASPAEAVLVAFCL